jgi:hypothetical protein
MISQWLDAIFYLDYLLKIDIPVIETVFLIITPLGISGLRVFSIFESSNEAKNLRNIPISEQEVIFRV